ncbi:hypothetical protein [Brachyspira sp. SAP_772]|uniref:hypothetical protein n=1 Tax=Brachyspira sp. SAP_772 TaxID=2608385 RepID=UPI0012F4D15E|nr:hypothetical protein [Brachyspira sp. SAP_772]
MKYIALLLIIFYSSLYSYNSEEINDFYNNYYSTKYDIKTIEDNSSQTYQNLYFLIQSKKIEDKKEKYNYLKEAINQNKDYEESDDIDYLISVSELMNYIMYYCNVSEKISFGSKSKDIYKNILAKDEKNFFALLGTGIGYMHAPVIAGGSSKKAFQYFNKALINAKETYQKYLAYVWLSQYYFKMEDNENYIKYIKMSKGIYENGYLLEYAMDRNLNHEKTL